MGRLNQFRHAVGRVARTEVGIHVVIATTFLALAAFAFAIFMGFRHSTSHVDSLAWHEERQLVSNYIDRSARTSITQQKLQLTWDDAFKAVGDNGRNFAWADVYIGDFLWTTFQYDHLFLVDAQGNLLRAWTHGMPSGAADFHGLGADIRTTLAASAEPGHVLGVPGEFRQLTDTRWPYTAEGRPLTQWASTLVRHDDVAAILTVAPILPDTDYSMLHRKPNYLVAVRDFDQPFLSTMSDALRLPQAAFQAAQPTGQGRNALKVKDGDGRVIGWLSWRSPPRSAMIEADVSPLIVAFFGFLIAVLAGGVMITRALLQALRDVRARQIHAQHMALHDAMTGLPNRSQFHERLSAALQALHEDPGLVIVVAYFDIDNFKYVNDTRGHVFGDGLIEQVARRCRKRLRPDDLLARFGGDEFVLLRVVRRGEPAVSGTGDDIMAVFAAPFDVEGWTIDITASCGICWAPDRGDDADDLLRNADIALYQAKQQGRARWKGFTPEMKEAVHRRHGLEVDLRQALAADQLTLAYQPIVEAADGRIAGLEALLRWNHPEMGPISPALFVPIAEQAGLMQALGDWVLRQVFTDMPAWPGVNVSINLSPIQMMEARFIEGLTEMVSQYHVDRTRVTFEVTEGVLMERGNGVFDVLEKLKAMGFGIALDDFGTGYSSLSYLRMFHFDRIKIDRSFVQNIENDFDAQSILRAIASLGRSLRMKIVAEGVETPLQRELVKAAGCDQIQGYLYWQAMPAAMIDDLLEHGPMPLKRLRKAG